MAHFAKLDENNIVSNVIVIDNKNTLDENGIEKEEIGIAYCKSLYGEHTKWIQTSFNSKIREKFAGIGDYYNETLNQFISPEGELIIDAEVVEPTKELE